MTGCDGVQVEVRTHGAAVCHSGLDAGGPSVGLAEQQFDLADSPWQLPRGN